MINTRLEDIGSAQILDLISSAVREGRSLDYKEVLPGNSDSEKKEFLADVSSFANTVGGDLLIGIAESNGIPTHLTGVPTEDLDKEILRLDSIIRDGIDPRIRYQIKPVQMSGSSPVLVIRIQKSWIAPHRVVFKEHDKFYARNSAGKYPLDVMELRNAFLATSQIRDQIKALRKNRIEEIQTSTSLPMDDRTNLILHIIPFESVQEPSDIEIIPLKQRLEQFKPFTPGLSYNTEINYEGVIIHSTRNATISYTQVFRNGVIEIVDSRCLQHKSPYTQQRVWSHLSIEKQLVAYSQSCLDLLKSLDVVPPIAIGLSLLNASDLTIEVGPFSEGSRPFGEQLLSLPEVIVESYEASLGRGLKSAIDRIWNACGYERSIHFDDNGNWVQ
jgi:hypothetical protein